MIAFCVILIWLLQYINSYTSGEKAGAVASTSSIAATTVEATQWFQHNRSTYIYLHIYVLFCQQSQPELYCLMIVHNNSAILIHPIYSLFCIYMYIHSIHICTDLIGHQLNLNEIFKWWNSPIYVRNRYILCPSVCCHQWYW